MSRRIPIPGWHTKKYLSKIPEAGVCQPMATPAPIFLLRYLLQSFSLQDNLIAFLDILLIQPGIRLSHRLFDAAFIPQNHNDLSLIILCSFFTSEIILIDSCNNIFFTHLSLHPLLILGIHTWVTPYCACHTQSLPSDSGRYMPYNAYRISPIPVFRSSDGHYEEGRP